jgi:long-chain acyl-CoA synthetase
VQQRTIGRLWRDAVAAGYPDPLHLVEQDGSWAPLSLAAAARRVDDLANGLLSIGIRKGDAFGIFASTRSEWSLFDFALGLVGAITAPVYANSSPHDCAYVLGHSESVGVLAEDGGATAAVESVRGELPLLRHVLTFDDLEGLAEKGRAFAARNPVALAEAERAVGEDDLFTYIYTSGTTGPPKGCMIRHRNYYEMAGSFDHMDNIVGAGDVMLLYLPLAHNFGRLMHLAGPYAGYTVAFCSDPYAVADALLAVRPTVFPSVPRIYEKIHGAALEVRPATGAQRRLGWAMGVGRRVSELRQEQRPIPTGLAAAAADRLVPRVKTGWVDAPRRARRRAAAPDILLPHARHPHPRGTA